MVKFFFLAPLLFAQIAFAQNTDVPQSLKVLGRGMTDHHHTLFLACVDHTPVEISNCSAIRPVQIDIDGKITWLGSKVLPFNASQLKEKFQDAYDGVWGKFQIFENRLHFSEFDSRIGWNWADRPMLVESEEYQKIAATLLVLVNQSGQNMASTGNASTTPFPRTPYDNCVDAARSHQFFNIDELKLICENLPENKNQSIYTQCVSGTVTKSIQIDKLLISASELREACLNDTDGKTYSCLADIRTLRPELSKEDTYHLCSGGRGLGLPSTEYVKRLWAAVQLMNLSVDAMIRTASDLLTSQHLANLQAQNKTFFIKPNSITAERLKAESSPLVSDFSEVISSQEILYFAHALFDDFLIHPEIILVFHHVEDDGANTKAMFFYKATRDSSGKFHLIMPEQYERKYMLVFNNSATWNEIADGYQQFFTFEEVPLNQINP